MPGSQDYFGGISDSRDRRRHQRQLSSLNYIKLGEGNGGILMNISQDGLAFTAAQTIAGEFIRRLRFQLEEKSEWIEASGRIVWLSDTRKAAGVQFVNISDADRDRIRQWIESQNLIDEIESTTAAPPKIRKEREVTPFPAPKHDGRKSDTQFEMLRPDIQKMFPSESALSAEGRHFDADRSDAVRARREVLNEARAASPSDFPAENVTSQATLPGAAQVEVPAVVSEAPRGAPAVENASQIRTAEPRFAQALQVETLPETHQDEENESARGLKKPEASETSDTGQRTVRVPNFGYGGEVRLDRSAVTFSEASAKSNQLEPNDSTDRAARVPTFGYQTSAHRSGEQEQEDWTNWVDPAAATHRSKLGFVVLGVLLVAAAFAIGMAFGHGSFEGFADSIREYLPDKYTQEPNASIPAADSATTASSGVEQTKTEAPAAQPQSENTASQATDAPATSSSAPPPAEPAASSSGTNQEPQAAGDSSEAKATAATGLAKTPDTAGGSAPILMAPAGGGKEPFRLTTPEEAISASSSVAISSQTTVIVPRDAAGAEAAQEPKRLQPGGLVFRADPQSPKRLGRNELEIVKLLATVGENGQVLNVQRLSGPPPFAAAAMGAVREWRYSPTLFDGRPVKTEEKITIVFRR